MTLCQSDRDKSFKTFGDLLKPSHGNNWLVRYNSSRLINFFFTSLWRTFENELFLEVVDPFDWFSYRAVRNDFFLVACFWHLILLLSVLRAQIYWNWNFGKCGRRVDEQMMRFLTTFWNCIWFKEGFEGCSNSQLNKIILQNCQFCQVL